MSKALEALNKIATIGEILVEVSKLHITPEEAIDEIRDCHVSDNYFIIRQALTPPTAEEVCKALSEHIKGRFIDNADIVECTYSERDKTFYDSYPHYDVVVSIKPSGRLKFNMTLPPDLIEMIGRFYKGVKE